MTRARGSLECDQGLVVGQAGLDSAVFPVGPTASVKLPRQPRCHAGCPSLRPSSAPPGGVASTTFLSLLRLACFSSSLSQRPAQSPPPRLLQADGVGGILAAYSAALHSVALAGPTLFTPVIHTACEYATRALPAADSQAYYVLLIITDGVINDMDNTIGAIVHAAQLPLSILIVGVGAADFSAMEVSRRRRGGGPCRAR